MSATVIPLRAARGVIHRVCGGPGTGAAAARAAHLDAVLLGLHDRQAELLAVIEGLRASGLAEHGTVGPLATDLETVSCQALAEVGLLIRRAERLATGRA